MSDALLTGKWSGYYEYGPQYTRQKGQRVSFTMDLVSVDGELQGTAREEVTETIMEGVPATVTGFFMGEMISLVKKYRWFYYLDDQGVLVADRKKASQEVHYSGTYDATEGRFHGDWEIERVIRDPRGDLLSISRGSWEIRKED